MNHLQKQRNWLRNAAFLCGVLMLSMLSCAPGFSQAPKGDLPAHQATLTWTAGTGTTSSNAYRCPGACSLTSGTFTVLNSARSLRRLTPIREYRRTPNTPGA